jgi:hypothetical protein
MLRHQGISQNSIEYKNKTLLPVKKLHHLLKLLQQRKKNYFKVSELHLLIFTFAFETKLSNPHD